MNRNVRAKLHSVLRRVVPAAALGAALAGCTQKNAGMTDALLDEARSALAPDARTAVFSVRGSLDGQKLTLEGEVQDSAMKAQLLQFLQGKGKYTIVDNVVSLPDPSVGDRIFGVIDVSVANLRTRPDHKAELASQALLGTPVSVLKKSRGWYLVQTPDSYLGWTDDRFVRMTGPKYEEWGAREKLIVTADVGWVRSGKARDAQPVSDVVAGALLALKGTDGAWYAVEYPDGRKGFLPHDEASPFDEWLAHAHDTPERIVATAKRFFGVPYLWGGTSAKGMDCSGFAKTVYFLNGVLLPRDADQQSAVGEAIDVPADKIDLRPGDLLFFGTHAGGGKPEKVTHVAISLGGRRFIHSSVDVHVSSLDPDDADYSESLFVSFLRARRVIGAGESSGERRLATIPYYGADEH